MIITKHIMTGYGLTGLFTLWLATAAKHNLQKTVVWQTWVNPQNTNIYIGLLLAYLWIISDQRSPEVNLQWHHLCHISSEIPNDENVSNVGKSERWMVNEADILYRKHDCSSSLHEEESLSANIQYMSSWRAGVIDRFCLSIHSTPTNFRKQCYHLQWIPPPTNQPKLWMQLIDSLVNHFTNSKFVGPAVVPAELPVPSGRNVADLWLPGIHAGM